MNDAPPLPAMVRFPAAFALAVFAAWILLVFTNDLGFVKAIHSDSDFFPGSYTAQFTLQRMALALAIASPALYFTDWLLKSRIQLVVITVLALATAVWLSAF